ncbi:Hypothetical protein NTJ_00090 [Nesidiocoris tenuis]|uniref:Uncharacterized protein n=1 Tax=Nesidiocoris tenuis TaxID=355587 RepID=A0ABN7A8T9_9HEMI|nr:Hypothetical protein NTJ_00090 [Nesidiocoris tenuis]
MVPRGHPELKIVRHRSAALLQMATYSVESDRLSVSPPQGGAASLRCQPRPAYPQVCQPQPLLEGRDQPSDAARPASQFTRIHRRCGLLSFTGASYNSCRLPLIVRALVIPASCPLTLRGSKWQWVFHELSQIEILN